jgi:2-dehydro-3-deoxyphosphooctonate aldolase (KDO 8-P synthase)
LLKAAADTGKVVKVKKGQFLAPWDMKNVYDKLVSFNANGIILTDRGTSFGYNTLVSDMRGLAIMAETGAPVFFDATHSVQQPGGIGTASGGQRQYVELLARCAIAAGVAGVYLEVHQDPDNAPSDGPCMLKLDSLEKTLSTLKKFDELRKGI